MSELRVAVEEVKPGTAVRLDGGREGVCLVRIDDDFYAVSDRCTHAEVSLSEGDVDVEDRCIECWKHGSSFSLLDGEPQSLPATRPVAVYPVRVEESQVVVTVP